MTEFSEEELKPLFKKEFEEYLNDVDPESTIIGWEDEYQAKAREREPGEAPANNREVIDLICKVQNPGTVESHYVIELKKELNKKALGQVFMYYYAYNRDLVIRADDPDNTEYPVVFPTLGYVYQKQDYYSDYIDFTSGLLDEKLPIVQLSIPDAHWKL